MDAAFNLAALTSLGSAAGGGAALAPMYSGLAQAIKAHPRIRNQWVRWILPVLGLALGTALTVGYIAQGQRLDPLGILGIYVATVGAAFGAEGLYAAAKNTAMLPPGPDNHPADAALAQSTRVDAVTTSSQPVPPVVPLAPSVPMVPPSPPSPLGPPSGFAPPSPLGPPR